MGARFPLGPRLSAGMTMAPPAQLAPLGAAETIG